MALNFFMRDNLNGAYELFKQLSSKEPDNIEYRLYLGKIALDMGERKKAKQEYKYLLLLDPINFEAHYGLSIVNYLEGKTQEAIKHAKQAKKLKPNSEQIERFLSKIRPSIKEKSLISTIKESKQQKEVTPEKTKISNISLKKKPIEKKEETKKVPSLLEQRQKIENIRDKINSKDLNEAEREIKSLLKEDPDKIEFIELQAEIIIKMKDYKRTTAYCEEKLSKDQFSKSSILKINLAIANSKLENHDKGIEILKEALEIEPENHRIWLELSNIYRRTGNEEETRNALNKATVLVTEKMTAKAKFSK